MASQHAEQKDLPSSGRKLAILVGIDEYMHGIPRLRNAVRDAKAVAQILHQGHSYEVRLLVDTQATLAGLRDLLSSLPNELSAQDRLILYFAGHGIAEELDEADGPQGFLLPQDARRDESTTFLPMTEVKEQLGHLPCRHMLLLLDCCFAGAFRWSQTRSLAMRPAILYQERYERYLRDHAWQVITSAAEDERALDVVSGRVLGSRGEGLNSPFATALCAGLSGAADLPVGGAPGDGVILASEVYLYLEESFKRLEQQTGRPQQRPMIFALAGRDKGEFVFLVPGRSLVLPSALELTEKNNPYCGLRPYGAQDKALFYGRQEVLAELCAHILVQSLTLLVAASGSGKTSLLHAGVLPQMGLDDGWHLLPSLRPGSRPLAALASLSGALGGPPGTPWLVALEVYFRQPSPRRVLLCIDQLEELLTQGSPAAEQAEFLHQLAEARGKGPVHVVLGLRADFEPHFAELGTPGARFPLRPMRRDELRAVVEGPAADRALYFEPPTLVDRLLDEVVETPGALPLLSFALSEMYRAYVRTGRTDRSLTAADYDALGSVGGALRRRLDEIHAALSSPEQALLLRVMARMISLEGGEVSRRRIARAELIYGPGPTWENLGNTWRAGRLVDALIGARLLIAGQDSYDEPYLEPAHDKVVLGWPPLWRLIRQEQEALLLHRRLTDATATWSQAHKRTRHLWFNDPRLPVALALVRQDPERLNVAERDFLRMSARIRRRRFSALLTVVLATFALLGGLVLYIQSARQQAQRQLAATYREQGRVALLKGDRERAALYLALAYQAGSRSSVVRFMLGRATIGVRATVLRSPKKPISDAAFSPDGSLLALCSEDCTTYIFDGHSGRYLKTLTVKDCSAKYNRWSGSGPHMVSFSSDSRLVRVRDLAFDAGTGEQVPGAKPHFASEEPWSIRQDPGFLRRYRPKFLDEGNYRTIFSRFGQNYLELPEFKTRLSFNQQRPLDIAPDETRLVASEDQEWLLYALDLSFLERIALRIRMRYFGDGAPRAAWLWTLPPFHDETHRLLSRHGGPLKAVQFSHNGTRVLTASTDRTARLWNASTGLPLQEFEGHSGAVSAAVFAADDRSVWTGSEDGTVRLWDAESGELRLHRDLRIGPITTIALSSDGTVLAAAGDKGRVAFFKDGSWWETHPGRGSEDNWISRMDLGSHGLRWLSSIDKSMSGKSAWLKCTGYGGVRDELSCSNLEFGVSDGDEREGNWRWATANPDITRLLVLGDRAHLLRVKENLSSVKDEVFSYELASLQDGIHGAFSPDGERFLTVDKNGKVQMWATDKGEPIFAFPEQAGAVQTAEFSPDGQQVVIGVADGTAHIWELPLLEEQDPDHMAMMVKCTTPWRLLNEVWLLHAADSRCEPW